MEARIAANAGRDPEAPTPEPGPSAPPPATLEEAEAIVRAELGDPVWVKDFTHHTGDDGLPVFRDPETGLLYERLPRLHPVDGQPL